MQLWDKKAKWRLLVALLNGIAGGLSVHLAILAYKRWGWHVFATMPVGMVVLLLALYPITRKLESRGANQSASLDEGK